MGKITLFIKENASDILIGLVVVSALFVMASKVRENNEAKAKFSSSIQLHK